MSGNLPPPLVAGVTKVLRQSVPSVAEIELAKARAAIVRNRPNEAGPAAKWRSIPLETRCVLVSVATAYSDIERTAGQGWQYFTDEERTRLGAMARAMVRGLAPAAEWLR